VRGRVPSTALAVLIGLAMLVGVGATGLATIHGHRTAGGAAYGAVHRGPSSPAATPGGQNVMRTAAVAPLRHLVAPDLMVTAARPMPTKVISKLRRVEKARSAITVDVGTVQVNGHREVAMAGDLSTLRGFTPPPTAASDQLWQNLANGDIAVSYAVAKAAHFAVGQPVLVGSHELRLGAVADFGLPRVGVVMSRATGARVGLKPRAGVLLSSPGHSADTLAANARDVVGRRATVLPMTSGSSTYSGKPRTYIELYKAAARTCPGLSWSVLAAIGQVESGHGRNVGPSSAGALGPMQFMPSTWAMWGVDADGDKKADIMNPFDAVYSAARYLCYYNPGASLANLKRAVFAYNHADWYVNEVLALAKLYR
jgi:hypothetical protein